MSNYENAEIDTVNDIEKGHGISEAYARAAERTGTMTTENRKEQYLHFMPISLTDIPLVTWLENAGFFEMPASIKYHGNYTGGLFDHSFAVATALVDLTKRLELKWEREESPYIVGMFHDLCKTKCYCLETEAFVENYLGEKHWKHRDDVLMPDHGALSVILAESIIRLTNEEIACIRWHMGAFEKDLKLWDYYGRAIEQYPNVLYSHTADMIASRICGV